MPDKKTSKKRRSDFEPHIAPERATGCMVEGCREPGAYKAPKSKDDLHEYQWMCLDHVREHNQKWDYFSGMERDEIEDFIKDSITGHRPTWDRESRVRYNTAHLHDALYEFLNDGRQPVKPPQPPLSAKLRKALSALDMEYPFTEAELKSQYRILVKKHHPDVNKGDKQSEETFKQITAAYHCLGEHIKNA